MRSALWRTTLLQIAFSKKQLSYSVRPAHMYFCLTHGCANNAAQLES